MLLNAVLHFSLIVFLFLFVFSNSIASRGMSISRPDAVTGKCRMIRHERDKKNDPNPKRYVCFYIWS